MRQMIELYEHNQKAYEAAKSMLAETGKAAIVHPTGTGKSFIAFKLCEDEPQKRICWLSPSEYIYKTQIENLKQAAGGYAPDNVWFCTYAKLMLMTDDELAEIKPDYIVLDEFHRCGAKMWGEGVNRLLTLYADTPLLGLSATAVRYLDDQRDMAMELFDGNVASDMSLGEAIARGILEAPKYVLSVFSYEKDLLRYKECIRRAKSDAVRHEAERYLEALRRALDKAENLDVIFERHIKERNGKYIVFCSNVEHMEQMMKKSAEWFARIDREPHIYYFYADDPAAERSFRAFKQDVDKEHLKLLFCIDALNEGIHVEDVSGVILLRPTVSPIIYKQQIGRALSAGGKNDVVIFDIVMNIDNLYSIDSIREEMREALAVYGPGGENRELAETFTIIDEVRDCREIFRKLNETLTASWDLMYLKAAEYYREHGDLRVPRRYRTADGCALGNWVSIQRRQYGAAASDSGEPKKAEALSVNMGATDKERIEKLKAIGMEFADPEDRRWTKYYNAAVCYAGEHGDLDVPAGYVAPDGTALGKWLCQLRFYRKSGCMPPYATEERIRLLENLGMAWDARDTRWEKNYAHARAYYEEHGDLDVPIGYVDGDGVRLGLWLNNVRKTAAGKANACRLTEQQIKRLSDIGMVWKSRRDEKWDKGFSEAESYHAHYGSLDVPAMYVTETGYRLGRWVRRQTERMRSGGLTGEQKAKLESIGMTW